MEPFVQLITEHGALSPEARVIKAQDYLALQDAGQLLAQARQEADEIRGRAEQAYEAEKARGYEEGMAAAKLEISEQMLETVDEAIDYFSRVERQVAEVVMASVRKILGEFDDEELTLQVAKNALHVVRNQKQVKLHVCPEQETVLKKRIAEIHAGYPGINYLEVIPDHRLSPGGCILETEIGVVDAGVDTQLKALENSLKARIGSQPRQG